MSSILMSIHPKYVEKLFNLPLLNYKEGDIIPLKRTEIRKRFKRKSIKYIYVYATSPISKIVGVLTIGDVYTDYPHELWQYHKSLQYEIDYVDFMEYLNEHKLASAIIFKGCSVFEKLLDPEDIVEKWDAPQNYRYLNSDELKKLKKYRLREKWFTGRQM